jgi:Zn-dependent protease/CBS domain-containing protein
MNSTLHLLQVRGIRIGLHITFPLILIWAAIQFGLLTGGGWAGAIFGIIVVSLLFVIVTLHELGHSFAALEYGVPVKEIVLLPIGGVAQLGRIPENPIQEFVIAIAGPAVNFVLAVLMGGVAYLLQIDLIGPLRQLADGPTLSFGSVFAYLFVYNIFLGVFNLIPAFPMDGGRVLRALLATRLNYVRATTIAVRVGRAMAWLMGLYGFLNGGFLMILVAFFVYMGAGQEEEMVKSRAILRGVTVRRAYTPDVQTLAPDQPLQAAIDLTLSTLQNSFPICGDNGLVGILTYPGLVKALSQHGAGYPIGQAMAADVKSVGLNDELFAVQQRFQEEQLDALPVLDNGQFAGLITARDIAEIYRLMTIAPDLAWRGERRAAESLTFPARLAYRPAQDDKGHQASDGAAAK